MIAAVSIIGIVLSSSFVAYGFTRFGYLRAASVFFSVLMATMFIPGQVLQIPIYEIYYRIGWLDTFWPFLIPPFLGGGIVNVFLVKQFMRGIPSSLFEAGELDGASELRMFAVIALPLQIPVMLTIAIFTFIGSWNDFFGPLIYLSSSKNYTLALLIYTFMCDPAKYTGGGFARTPWNLVSALSMISMVPIFVIYAFAQKYFMEGIALTGVKGEQDEQN
jgi:multiple sugar transport system permease protein